MKTRVNDLSRAGVAGGVMTRAGGNRGGNKAQRVAMAKIDQW